MLVTRPALQTAGLCEQIAAHGGTALPLPAIAIEPLEAPPAAGHDLIVFLSVYAVAHGLHLVRKTPGARVAAIGKATAAALAQHEMPADIVPDAGYTSEALLAHPQLDMPAGSRVLIVHGEGGRGLLQQTFLQRGLCVETREVYRRVRPTPDPGELAQLEERWANEEQGIDVVTLTSVETLHNLLAMLTPRGRELLRDTALLVVSTRIEQAARAAGLCGHAIVAPSAEDAAIIGSLALWRMRAREPSVQLAGKATPG